VISDGDLRRLLEQRGKDALDLTAGDCMTRNPKDDRCAGIRRAALARMEEMKITSLVVVVDSVGENDAALDYWGIVHLHDLWGTEMV
jgi:arabinose-5-phosphate isomerase